MVKQYKDVLVSDLQCIYDAHGDETVCDADRQHAVIESNVYELIIDK